MAGGLFLLSALTGMADAWQSRILTGLALGGLAVVIALLGPQLRSMHPLIAVQPLLEEMPAEAIPALRGKSPEAIAWGYTGASLVYYGERPWKFLSKAAQTEARLKERQAGVAVTLYQEWTLTSWLKAGLPPEGTSRSGNCEEEHARFLRAAGEAYELLWITGLNPARSSLVKLAVWKRRPAP